MVLRLPHSSHLPCGPGQLAVAMPDVIERFHQLGTYSRDYTPAQTGEFMRSEEKLWWPIVRQVNKEQAK